MDTTTLPLHRLSAQDHAALFDAAKARAIALRSEAIDAFWSQARRAIVHLARRGWRSLPAAGAGASGDVSRPRRTNRPDAAGSAGIPRRAVQNSPHGNLRLLDP